MPVRQTAQIRCRSLWLPRRGHAEAEYEDACAASPEGAFPFRAAIADGATEAAFSGAWARQLAGGWAAECIQAPEDFLTHVAAWQEAWQAAVAHRSDTMPWYAVAKAEEGTFATFLGLHLGAHETWRAVAVGDCCLFHLRGTELLASWPLTVPEAFGHTPNLIPSRHALPPGHVLTRSGTWDRGDTFLLATDALAAWLLRTAPSTALGLDTDSFERAVNEARDRGALRNDDVTLLIIHIADH